MADPRVSSSQSTADHTRPPRWAWIKTRGAAFLIILTLGLNTWSLDDSRKAITEGATQQSTNITIAVGQTLDRALASLDLSLQAAARGMNIDDINSMPHESQQAVLFSSAEAIIGFSGFIITDTDGKVTYHTENSILEKLDYANTEYFQAHKNHKDLGFVLSGPMRDATTGHPIEIFSRRITRPDGSFGGIAASALDLVELKAIFAKLALKNRAAIVVLNTDGHVIMRYPSDDADIGKDMSKGGVMSHFRASPTGTFVDGVAKWDGVERLFSYREFPDYPLVIAVGFSTEDIYAAWVRRAELMTAALVILAMLYFYLTKSLEREIDQRRRTERDAREAQAGAEHATELLAESLARHTALFTNTADSMMVARATGKGDFIYEAVNPVWEQMTGLKGDDVVNRTPAECLPGPMSQQIESGWQETTRLRVPIHYQFTSPGKGGETEHWDALTCPVFASNGEIRRLIGVARNMTEQRRLQDKLRHAHRLEAVGELTAGIAHDFNNLLQAIVGSLEMVQDQPAIDKDGKDALGIATRAANQAASLVHQLLAFSRKQRLDPVLLHLKTAAPQIEGLVRSAIGRDHQFFVEVSEDAGPVLVDPGQLNNCILNLALNARDATPKGKSLRLRISPASPDEAAAADVTPGHYTRFIFEDEGNGISPEHLARVFEPFFSTKQIGKGTGLGLSMVQGFARQSGGDTTLESSVGIGTTVTIWLPNAKARPASKLSPPYEISSTPPKASRVLLVDDDASVRQTLSLFLRRSGYETVVRESGEHALVALQNEPAFDLLVTDQSMPGISGTELIEQALVKYPDMPTLLITGFDLVTGI